MIAIGSRNYRGSHSLSRRIHLSQRQVHVSSPSASVRAKARANRKKAQIIGHAPPSIASIPDDAGDSMGRAGAFIRPVGCTRRVFLMKPYLTPDEIEGLAYRIRVLGQNDSINSVLIATDDDDPVATGALPSSILELDALREENIDDKWIFPPKPGQTWQTARGYDPVAWFKSGKYKDSASVASLLDSVRALALATRGDPKKSRIPVITIPHGLVQDAGYALCLSSYTIATERTAFRILNPSRGLTFDPVGFSFILPRLGEDFNQPSAEFKGCGQILALMGYEASGEDMVELGLATHFMENPTAIMGTLERTLSELPPWNQQRYLKKPVQLESDRQRFKYTPSYELPDHFKMFRNVSIASTIEAFTSYRADAAAPYTYKDEDNYEALPASFNFDPVPWHEERVSDLVEFAAAFNGIFQKESSVEGLLERFREVAGQAPVNPEEQELAVVAADFVKRMEDQSPLALKVTHKLMQIGQQQSETLESCMEREKTAQANLMKMPDFENWAKAQLSTNGSKPKPFKGWQHKSASEVTQDEVEAVLN